MTHETHDGLHSRARASNQALGVFLAAIIAVVFGAGCDRGAGGSANDRPLEVLVSSEPETLDPRHAVDAVSHRITRLLHAGLTTLDPQTLEPRPLVAERFTLSTPVTLELDLRPGLVFQSGARLTSRDVVASLRAYMNPKISARTARAVEPIASVEERGELGVVIRLKRPHATILTDLELPILRADETEGPPRPNGSLDGLGPYRVSAVTPGEVRLIPASGGPTAARHAVTIRTVRDENARALRLLAGRADVALNVFSPTLLPALDGRSALAVARRPGANVTYLLLRVDRTPFDRLEARRAASLALDRRALTDGLLAGAARPASGTLPPSLWTYSPAAPLPFDPERARRDVAEMRGLRFTLLTTPDRVRLSIARTIAQSMRDVGADVEVASLELGALLARLTAGDFDAAILNMPELTEPNVLRTFLHSTSIPPAGANRGRIRDAVVDRLLDEGSAVSDRSARTRLYAELEAHLRATHVFVPLWHEDQVSVTSERARGFVPTPEGRYTSLASLR